MVDFYRFLHEKVQSYKNVKYLFYWFIELLLMIFHLPLSALNYVLPFEPKKQSKYKTAVLMVERWFRRNPLHFFMKIYLEKRGFDVYCLNLPLLEGTFEESGARLRDFIEEKKLDSVILVGISGGGLSCLQYLNDHNGWQKTKLLIGVSTPFRGARLSMIMPFKVPREDLAPNGLYIQSVLAKEYKNTDKIYCIAARYDQMVGHAESFLPGAHAITLDVVGHNLVHTLYPPTYKLIHELCIKHE